MTISYSGNFARLLLRWKGSVWKTTWKELIAWLLCYYLIRIIYRYALSLEQKITFEKVLIITEFDDYTKRIPLTFILGFYVATVVKRWWEQFQNVAWPDSCLNSLYFFMQPSGSEDGDTISRRRTIARYLNLCMCLAYRDISVRVRKRFPTLEHLTNAQLMTEEEVTIYRQSLDSARWFLPLQWAQNLVEEYCKKNPIQAPYVTHFLTRLAEYRLSFHRLFCYDWICIPLVYTQVSALATYGYFVMCFIGRQFMEDRSEMAMIDHFNQSSPMSPNCTRLCNDYYFPIFSVVEFLFYVGWFKVAQDIMRPFEEDDDDYELNYIVDRNIRVSVAIANSIHQVKPTFPPSCPFSMWDDANLVEIPYTKLSKPERNHPPKMHAYVDVKNASDCEVFKHATIQRQKSSVQLKREQTKRWRYF